MEVSDDFEESGTQKEELAFSIYTEGVTAVGRHEVASEEEFYVNEEAGSPATPAVRAPPAAASKKLVSERIELDANFIDEDEGAFSEESLPDEANSFGSPTVAAERAADEVFSVHDEVRSGPVGAQRVVSNASSSLCNIGSIVPQKQPRLTQTKGKT